MSEDIAAALRAAVHAVRGASHGCYPDEPLSIMSKCMTTKAWRPCVCERQASAAVAAFLRALPEDVRVRDPKAPRAQKWAANVRVPAMVRDALASAVEEAARHE